MVLYLLVPQLLACFGEDAAKIARDFASQSTKAYDSVVDAVE